MAFCYSGDRHKQPDEEDGKQRKATDQDLNTDRNDYIVQMRHLLNKFSYTTLTLYCKIRFREILVSFISAIHRI